MAWNARFGRGGRAKGYEANAKNHTIKEGEAHLCRRIWVQYLTQRVKTNKDIARSTNGFAAGLLAHPPCSTDNGQAHDLESPIVITFMGSNEFRQMNFKQIKGGFADQKPGLVMTLSYNGRGTALLSLYFRPCMQDIQSIGYMRHIESRLNDGTLLKYQM